MNYFKRLFLFLTILVCTVEAQTGLLIPFYADPSLQLIQPLLTAKKSHPSVPMRVILNTSVADDTQVNSVYSQGISALKAANIQVLGRVNTNYNLRSLNEVLIDIKNWKELYNVDGIFLDSLGAAESYYHEIAQFIHTIGMTVTVGNAGDNVDPTYSNSLDTLVIANQAGLPSLSDYANWNHNSINQSLSSLIIYNVGVLPISFINEAQKFIGWLYITNGSGTAPYNALPFYFQSLVTLLDQNMSSKTGSIVPFYIYPTTTAIQPLINAKKNNPSTPLLVILNPNSGVSTAINQDYVKAFAALRQEGITTLGYVHTSYGQRNLDEVKAEVAKWYSWYQPDGIFFDEMGLNHPYYQALQTQCKSLGALYTVGNPGSLLDVSASNDLDIINIFENAFLPNLNGFSSWTNTKVPRVKMSTLSYNIQQNQPAFNSSAAKTFGWIYYTSGGGNNPWGVLPSYFGDMISNLEQGNTAK